MVEKKKGRGRTMNRNTPLVSVIVPVYNSSAYLRTCCDRVLHQSYTNLELVLVDDGSTDGSSAICDEYAKRYDNVQVVHQSNGGESAARNTGLSVAQGEYIMWVDSDDWIDPDWVASYMELAVDQAVDVVVAGRVTGQYGYPQALIQYLLNHIEHTIWISCVRRVLFDGLSFSSHTIGCDALMLTKLFAKAHSTYVMPRPEGYHYMDNEESVTRVHNIGTRMGWPARAQDELDFVAHTAPELMSCARFDVMRGAGVIYRNVRALPLPPEERERKKVLLKQLRRFIAEGMTHLPMRYMSFKDYKQVILTIRDMWF